MNIMRQAYITLVRPTHYITQAVFWTNTFKTTYNNWKWFKGGNKIHQARVCSKPGHSNIFIRGPLTTTITGETKSKLLNLLHNVIHQLFQS